MRNRGVIDSHYVFRNARGTDLRLLDVCWQVFLSDGSHLLMSRSGYQRLRTVLD